MSGKMETCQTIVVDSASADKARSTGPEGIRSAFRLVIWAIWFGILTGYLELLNLGFKKYVLGRLILLGHHTLWLAPLVDATLFLLLGVILVPMTLLRPTRFSERLAIFVFGFTLAASLVLLYTEIHPYAALLLAGGVAIQMMRCICARVEMFDRLVRRTLPWMIAACIGAAVLLPAWWAWSENRAIRALPRTAEASPNVLIVVWDTVRAKSLSTYGYDRDTSPNLTRLGKRGVLFESALSTSPWTLPSHASFFTGRWAHDLSATWDVPLDETYPTLAEVLTTKGYVTAGFVANQVYCSRVHGLGRGFLHYEDFNLIAVEFILSCQVGRQLIQSARFRRLMGWKDFWGRKSAERINSGFLRWIDTPTNRPFFAFLNYFDAHDAYLPPPPFDEKFGPSELRRDFQFVARPRAARTHRTGLTPEQLESEQNAYDGSIAYLDECLGRLFGELEERELLDNTIVIVTSDHGEQFGEHGYRGHGYSLYRPLIHVPLVIRYPKGTPSGLRLSHIVSLRDLPATILDLLGYADESLFPGDSLRRCWEGVTFEHARKTALYASVRPQSDLKKWDHAVDAVITEGLNYIEFGDGHEELYDFDNDPLETRDLISAENLQETLSRLRGLIKHRAKEQKKCSVSQPGRRAN